MPKESEDLEQILRGRFLEGTSEGIANFPGSSDDPVVRLQRPGLTETLFSNLTELAAGSILGLVLAYFLLANEGVFLNTRSPRFWRG